MPKVRIYIAGPYCPRDVSLHDASRIAQRNMDKAIETFHKLKKLGHYPFVPHLTHYVHTHYSCPEDYGDWWYEYDLGFLSRWANALYYMDPSKGADLEKSYALSLGYPVFTKIEEVPDIRNSEKGERQ